MFGKPLCPLAKSNAGPLSRVFKNSPQFWLGLQMDWELWYAERDLAEVG